MGAIFFIRELEVIWVEKEMDKPENPEHLEALRKITRDIISGEKRRSGIPENVDIGDFVFDIRYTPMIHGSSKDLRQLDKSLRTILHMLGYNT
jgi:hypothetical protein